MTKQSAGHLIVESLKRHGVERVFSVPGESYLDVLMYLYQLGYRERGVPPGGRRPVWRRQWARPPVSPV